MFTKTAQHCQAGHVWFTMSVCVRLACIGLGDSIAERKLLMRPQLVYADLISSAPTLICSFQMCTLLCIPGMLVEGAVLLGTVMPAAGFPPDSASTPCGVAIALQVEIADVINLETNDSIKYALQTQLQTDGYEVV